MEDTFSEELLEAVVGSQCQHNSKLSIELSPFHSASVLVSVPSILVLFHSVLVLISFNFLLEVLQK